MLPRANQFPPHSISAWRGSSAVARTLLIAALAACKSTSTIHDGPIRLQPGVWTTVSTKPFHVSGPRSELCLEVDTDASQRWIIDTLIGPGGVAINIRLRIGADSGAMVNLDAPGTLRGAGKPFLCFRQVSQMGDRTFHRVDLLSKSPTVVRSITWWSGKASAFL
jgi:hypothetical protein